MTGVSWYFEGSQERFTGLQGTLGSSAGFQDAQGRFSGFQRVPVDLKGISRRPRGFSRGRRGPPAGISTVSVYCKHSCSKLLLSTFLQVVFQAGLSTGNVPARSVFCIAYLLQTFQ